MTDYYKPQPATLDNIEFDATMPDRVNGGRHRVHVVARHLRYHEYSGLSDALIGEVQVVADPTGKQELKARRIKLKRVAVEVSNLDPDRWRDGRVTGEELARWIDDDANADAVFAAWHAFVECVDSPPLKSAAEDRGDRGSENEGEAQEAEPVALVSTV